MKIYEVKIYDFESTFFTRRNLATRYYNAHSKEPFSDAEDFITHDAITLLKGKDTENKEQSELIQALIAFIEDVFYRENIDLPGHLDGLLKRYLGEDYSKFKNDIEEAQ